MEAKKARASLDELPRVTGATLKEYRETLIALRDQANIIKQMTEKYPVFLLVAGKYYCFEVPEHVDQFVSMLEREVQGYRPSGGASTAAASG